MKRRDFITLLGGAAASWPLAARAQQSSYSLKGLGSGQARPGIRFNEHIEGDGPTVFAHACKMGLEGIVSEAEGLRLSFRPLARLAQDEERRCAGSEARSRHEILVLAVAEKDPILRQVPR